MTESELPITPFMPLAPKYFLRKTSDFSEYADFFAQRELLASGRGAILRALSSAKFDGVLWLPEYFCPSIKKLLSANFRTAFFDDIPSESSPRFETLKAARGDAVLAVNFFGLRDRRVWDAWSEKNRDAILIEDHSHAPFSDWAIATRADFAFASLRKYLPLPDGAYLFSKSREPSKMYSTYSAATDFSADALAAAALARADYPASLPLYYSSEAKLNACASAPRISRYSYEILSRLDIEKIALARAACAKAFAENLNLAGARDLTPTNIAAHSPRDVFAPTLKFSDPVLRDKTYASLRLRDIFAVIYWGGQGAEVSPLTRAEQSSIFTIPLDFRHSIALAKELAKSL